MIYSRGMAYLILFDHCRCLAAEAPTRQLRDALIVKVEYNLLQLQTARSTEVCTRCVTIWMQTLMSIVRAGVRHVGVRLNRAAIWTIKIPYKLTCHFERLGCLDYGANTDINDTE